MRILFSPQVSDERIIYEFHEDRFTAIHYPSGVSDIFDFKGLPDGEVDVESVETKLPLNPLISAKKVDGEIHVELLNWISTEAPREECFPEWIEHTEYTWPTFEPNGKEKYGGAAPPEEEGEE